MAETVPVPPPQLPVPAPQQADSDESSDLEDEGIESDFYSDNETDVTAAIAAFVRE